MLVTVNLNASMSLDSEDDFSFSIKSYGLKAYPREIIDKYLGKLSLDEEKMKTPDKNAGNSALSEEERMVNFVKVLKQESDNQKLSLHSRKLSSSVLTILLESLPATAITVLNLDGNQVDDRVIEKLIEVLPKTKITELSLNGDQASLEMLNSLTQMLSKTKIWRLELR